MPKSNALQWIRWRQHSLGGAVLAAFCLAWLQLAAMPCAMAYAAADDPPCHETRIADPCACCVAAHPDDRGHQQRCAYPDDPQVDVRDAGALHPPALPMLTLLSAVDVATPGIWRHVERPPIAPPRALTARYCRYLE